MPIIPLLGLLFVGLKLTGHIDWSWWLVTLPFWGGLVVALTFLLVGGSLAAIFAARRFALPWAVTGALLLLAAPAHAADTVVTAAGGVLDALRPFLSEILLAVLTGIGGALVAELRKRGFNTDIWETVGRGGGLAYTRIVQSGQPISTPGLIAGAVAEGAEYVAERVPDTLRKRGVTPEAVTAMVAAQLGKLLAGDPTISVGSPVLLGKTLPAA
ncbi:hypothetical protein [Roseomonas sp. USHLN139]|uniref:hypothetical protein n=1 Tax=Roseomonas sp. USHLN139 TaxID=3081298 RepID=UPI003B022D96